MVGRKGAKRGAVRLGCGIASATLMAVALPVSTGWGAIDSPSRAGSIIGLQDQLNRCNGADLDLDGIYGPETGGTVVRIQRSAGIDTDGIYRPQTAEAMKWGFTDSQGKRSCETLSGTRLIALR